MLQVSLSAREVFAHQDLESMTKQQLHFAQEQLRSIFSHEMSKVSVTLGHKRQVSSKQLELEQQQKEQLQELYRRLGERMAHVDCKRRENIQRKVESCRSHDEEWRNRVAALEQKIKRESREAEAKALKYHEQHEQYLKRKEMESVRRDNRKPESVHLRASDDERRPNTQLQFVQPAVSVGVAAPVLPLTQRNPRSRNKLDLSIRKHKQRSQQLQLDRQYEILQKALVKLDTINKRRKKLNSEHEPHRQETTIRKAVRVDAHCSSSPKHLHYSSMAESQSPRTSNRVLPQISQRSDQKKTRELKQVNSSLTKFQERGEILHRNLERSRKQFILRQIKEKVTEYKVLAQRQI